MKEAAGQGRAAPEGEPALRERSQEREPPGRAPARGAGKRRRFTANARQLLTPSLPPDRDHLHTFALGATLFLAGNAVGLALLVGLFVVPAAMRPDGVAVLLSMAVGGLLAFPACAVYALVPRLLDRYDTEPLWAVGAMFAWGALAASGLSAALTSAAMAAGRALLGETGAEVLGTDVCAPIVEELFKGLGVAGAFHFLRREFDGIVDGIVYATFVGLGFATVENVVYYARAGLAGHTALVVTFFLRGVLSPWGHPLYTGLTGLGFGIARERGAGLPRWGAPIAGFAGAVLLHAAWNATASVARLTGASALRTLGPAWVVVLLAYGALVTQLVRRKGRILRACLMDEVALGHLTAEELEEVAAPWAPFRARVSAEGQEAYAFTRTAGRLAFFKWHALRAAQRGDATVSAREVGPLRERLKVLRAARREAPSSRR